MLENKNEIDAEIAKFDAQRDINESDKKEIKKELLFLYKKAVTLGDEEDWEEYAEFSMYKKFLFQKENDSYLNTSSTYKAMESVAQNHLRKGQLNRYLKFTASKKILYPQEWNWGAQGKDFHHDEIIWDKMLSRLEQLKPQSWEDENKYKFFEFAQNLKIVSPTRFESLNFREIVGEYIWEKQVENELEELSENCWDFTIFASSLQILNFPRKITLDTLEWAELEEEAQKFLSEGKISDFVIFSGARNILSARKLHINEDRFDLIF